MKSQVYIETTIPSFYYEVRGEPEMVARRNWTREWWKSYRQLFQLTTSEAVLAELEEGEYKSKDEAIALLDDVESLAIPDEAADIVDVYIDNHLMPRERLGDALHLAIASFYKCDFLLTWNCRHIANATNSNTYVLLIHDWVCLYRPWLHLWNYARRTTHERYSIGTNLDS